MEEVREARRLEGLVRGPLPIVVGITGHRDIRPEDVPTLSDQIAVLFEQLTRAHRSTPILLLSPLAVGADRIAAHIAMEARFSIPVVVPLPLERAEYEKDFDAAERTEFDRMIARAHCHYFVGYAPGNDARSVANDPAARNRQYAQVGSYIARNSQLLIALWNGLPSDAVGGTAQVVTFKREGVPDGFGPERKPLDPPENGPVFHIVTPRASNPSVNGGELFAHVELKPSIDSVPEARQTTVNHTEVAQATYRRMDRFNRDAVAIGITSATLSATALRTAADSLAKRCRDATFLTIVGLFALALLTAALFELYAHGLPAAPVLGFDVAISAVALVWYGVARQNELQNRFQDYRAIAEGLRVQEYWQRADVAETVADHYLRAHRGELDWIRHAIRACRVLDATAHREDRPNLATRRQSLRDVCADWIDGPDGQLAYFADRIAVNERRERRWRTIGFTLLWISLSLTIAATVVYGPLQAVFAPWLGVAEEPLWRAVIIAISLSAVGSGLAQGYANIRAYGQQAKQYLRMQSVYWRARSRLTVLLAREPFDEQTYRDAQRTLTDLGEEALAEHGAWVMLHRERPLEYVRGG